MGKTLDELGEMDVSEFAIWNQYAVEQVLPWRRMEHYMAQIVYAVAVTMGGSKAKSHADFLMQFAPSDEVYEDATAEEHAELLRVLAGGKNPRVYADK